MFVVYVCNFILSPEIFIVFFIVIIQVYKVICEFFDGVELQDIDVRVRREVEVIVT